MKKHLLLLGTAVAATLSAGAFTPRAEMPMENSTQVNLRNAVSFIPAEVKTVSMKKNAAGAMIVPADDGGTPVSSYKLPNGVFHWGLLSDLTGMAMMFGSFDLVGPMFEELTWTNTTPQADSYSWSYRDADFKAATSTDKDLKTPAYVPGSGNSQRVIAPPTLTSYIGAASNKYQECSYIKYGGGAINGTLQYGACTYKRLKTLQVTMSPMMGKGCDDALTAGLVNAGTITGGDAVKTVAYGNYFEKPQRPYALYGMNVLAYTNGVVDAAAGLTMKIYECSKNADGSLKMGSLIAASTIGKDDITVDASTSLSDCKFAFAAADIKGEAGPLVISTGIYCELSGIDSFSTFYPVFPGMPERYENNGYISADVTSNGSTVNQKIPTSFTTYSYTNATTNVKQDMYCTDLMFHLWMFYAWMECADDEFVVTADGGQQDFTVQAYDSSDTWTVCTTAGEDIPSWIRYATTDATIAISTNPSAYAGQTTLTIMAAPIGDGDPEYRECEIYMGVPGAYHVIKVKQGAASGVEAVSAKERVTVKADGGNFVISAPAAVTAVSIYNVSGQLVDAEPVNGETTVSAQNLDKGLYILKFNNGVSVKVVK